MINTFNHENTTFYVKLTRPSSLNDEIMKHYAKTQKASLDELCGATQFTCNWYIKTGDSGKLVGSIINDNYTLEDILLIYNYSNTATDIALFEDFMHVFNIHYCEKDDEQYYYFNYDFRLHLIE